MCFQNAFNSDDIQVITIMLAFYINGKSFETGFLMVKLLLKCVTINCSY